MPERGLESPTSDGAATRRPLKVGLLYPLWFDFPPARAEFAMDVVGTELSAGLAAIGHDVDVFSRSRHASTRREWLLGSSSTGGGCRFVRLPKAADSVARRLLAIRSLFARGTRALDDSDHSAPHRLGYGLPAAVRMRIAGGHVAHVCIFDELVPLIRRLSPRTTIVLHMHDHKQASRDWRTTSRNLGQADAIVGCSEFITDAVRRRFPDLAPRCRTIRNAYDPALYDGAASTRRPREEERILFVGRLSPEKGVHTILQAFAKVHERAPGTRLLLVGQDSVAPLREADPTGADPRFDTLRDFYRNPESYARFLREAVPSELRTSVEFLSPVDHPATARHFAEADIVVFPAIWDEPFGLPVLEAMASGVPVVATRVGGIPETVADGETGILVPPDDPDALADAQLRLLDDETLRIQMGKAGRRRAEELFTWKKRLDEWDALYSSLKRTAA
jgi:glycosyltransferase involved in cell wall biosynthesis